MSEPPAWLQPLLTQWNTERTEQQAQFTALTAQLTTSNAAVQQLAAAAGAVVPAGPDPALATALADLAAATQNQTNDLSFAVQDAADELVNQQHPEPERPG